MRALIDARAPAETPASVFETRLLRSLRDAGLPKPEVQHEIKVGGRHIARVDFAYPSEQIAIEADSYGHHSSRLAWEHDRARMNVLTGLGWRVLHVTWLQLESQPSKVVRAIEALMTSR
jgi:very-short-patch-repair endonuclease